MDTPKEINGIKVKPFNLEEAMNGAKVITRGGREVSIIIRNDGFATYQLNGWIISCKSDGFHYGKDVPADSDIFLIDDSTCTVHCNPVSEIFNLEVAGKD